MPQVTARTVDGLSTQPLWFIDNLAYVLIQGKQTGEAYGLTGHTVLAGGAWAARHASRRYGGRCCQRASVSRAARMSLTSVRPV